MKISNCFFVALAIITSTFRVDAAAPLEPAVPPNIVTSTPRPMIMLNMSKDHQLFYRAYDEYSDIDGDGSPDTTYKHSFDYYGYFDPVKCYDYNAADGRFDPAAISANKYCLKKWSGNFLNWATMSRMDVVRKVLYGGLRWKDDAGTTGKTVLERANLPTDAHSFSKFYGGDDLDKLTPFLAASLSAGLTMCNTTLGGSGANQYSQTNTMPPIMRVAKGNFQLWNANEKWQCYWSEEKAASNGNNFNVTGLVAGGSNPGRTADGLKVSGTAGPDYNVRVSVCDAGADVSGAALVGSERCRKYPAGTLKPIGLLHEYGEADAAEFALFTGSFEKNISGGVLRSNMSSFKNEVNSTTNGTFVASSKGIVYTLNNLRIYGYNYSNSLYYDDGLCDYQLTGLKNNQCTSWGNPMGEIFIESLRYLGGKTPSSNYEIAASSPKDASMGLPTPGWIDPFKRNNAAEKATLEAAYGEGQCRPVNAVHFNASVTSYDNDSGSEWTPFTDLPGSPNLASFIDTIGADEGIHGKKWFVGSIKGGLPSEIDRLCTVKTVKNLSKVAGLCPDAPAYFGSYALSGAAYWARTNKFRTDLPVNKNPEAFRVNSFSVALSAGKPRIEVPHPSLPGRKVVIQPSYRLDKGAGNYGGGTLVDFRVVSQTPTSGKFLVIWEDSEQGGDYDQDASGILRYEVTGGKLFVYTSTFADATANPQGFGYTISGTEKDGVHFHSGILGFNYTDPTLLPVRRENGAIHPNINASGGCSNCQKNQFESRAEYGFSDVVPVGQLQDPLWYAAKWGGFTTEGGLSKPNANGSNWDVKKTDGAAGSDGVPDNYFLATRPNELEKALRSAFNSIISASNTAPAAASGSLGIDDLKYEASFDPKDGHGEIAAYQLLSDDSFDVNPLWSGGLLQSNTAASARVVITNEGQVGKAFTWAALSNTAKVKMFGSTNAVAQSQLDWLRGARTNEAPNGFNFRQRSNVSTLGAIVNSNPVVVSSSNAQYFGPEFPGYSAFISRNASRKKVIWVGAGDGMLHAFDATSTPSGGSPLLSYIPEPLQYRLNKWISPAGETVQSFVDGSPFSADVLINSSWRTYLFSSLGRGEKGMFALDVTDPTTFAQGNASTLFKWQFAASDDVAGDLGYNVSDANVKNTTFNQSSLVAKMNNGKFATLFPNGVGSDSGKAALYLLFANGPSATGWVQPSDYRKIVADPLGVGSNGLSEPTWVDIDGNGTADFIYAGDLKGNLWKFDVTSSNPADWKVAFGGLPLYIAKSTDASLTGLPIIAAPTYQFHPNGGVVVVVATGKAILPSDFPVPSTVKNAVFGVWDKPAYWSMGGGALADATTGLPRNRASLLKRDLQRVGGDGYLANQDAKITWLGAGAKKGWFIEWPAVSEMVVSNLRVVSKILFINSIVPPESSVNSCTASPKAFETYLDPVNGNLGYDAVGTIVRNGATYNVVSKARDSQKTTVYGNKPSAGTNGGGVGGGGGGGGGGSAGCPGASLTSVGAKDKQLVKLQTACKRVQWREIPGLKTQ